MLFANCQHVRPSLQFLMYLVQQQYRATWWLCVVTLNTPNRHRTRRISRLRRPSGRSPATLMKSALLSMMVLFTNRAACRQSLSDYVVLPCCRCCPHEGGPSYSYHVLKFKIAGLGVGTCWRAARKSVPQNGRLSGVDGEMLFATPCLW